MKKGFTMPEILVAVLIVTILVTMAVPMYERAVEKSRIAEVSVTLKRIGESKLRVMDDRNIVNYTGTIDKKHLDTPASNTADFVYGLLPNSFPNAVCAIRAKGDHRGTAFLYLGETAHEYCNVSTSGVYSSPVCVAYRVTKDKLFCQGNTNTACDSYSMNNTRFGSCSQTD